MAALWKRIVKKAIKKKKKRNLWVIYQTHYDDTDFDYRVKDERGRLAFGSSAIRDCANPSNYGVSRLAVANNVHNIPEIGPGKYDAALEESFPRNKELNAEDPPQRTVSLLEEYIEKVSLNGYGGLARTATRFEGAAELIPNKERKYRTPSIYEYSPDICHPQTAKNQYTWPFKAQHKVFDWSTNSNAPDGSLYFDGIRRNHNLGYFHCFGGKKRLKNHVFVKCQPYNTDECIACGNPCESQDYWTSSGNFLCLSCMSEQRLSNSLYSSSQLDKFQKIRSCSFMHMHEGTMAQIPLKSSKELAEQTFHECYFSSFFDESKNIAMKPRLARPKRKYGGRVHFMEQLKIQPLKIP